LSLSKDLVARPQDWPGVHAARVLVAGEALTGTWFDRTQEYAARRRGEDFDRLKYATTETLHLSPLPCWKDLPADVWKGRTLHLIHEIEEEATVRRSRTGSQPLGVAAIRVTIPTIVRSSRRSRPLRCSTPGAPRCATSSGKPTPGSSRPSGTPRKSCERETATRLFRSAASLRSCPSWEGSVSRPRGPQTLE
jgi:hypothetical protein